MESIPLEELLSLVEDISAKTREASSNTNLDMRQFLGIDKASQSMQGELLNNTSKLTEINKRIQRDTKKLEEVESHLYGDTLDDLNTKKTAKAGNTVTKLQRFSSTSCKDQANH